MSAPPRIVLFATRDAWAEDDAGVRALLVRLHADDTVLRIEDLGPDDLGESDLVVVVSLASAPRLAAPAGHRGDHVVLLLGEHSTPSSVPVYHYPRDLDALLARLHAHTGGRDTKAAAPAIVPPPTPVLAASPSALTIMFASASPVEAVRLRVDREFRQVIDKLRGARHRDRLRMVPIAALRFEDLRTALLEHEPHVLHLSGHGEPDGSLKFESGTEDGPQTISKRKLLKLLRALGSSLRLVVFNACHSAEIARDVPPTIGLSIGMNKAIFDSNAVEFSVAFYEALAFGKTVQTAFDAAIACLDADDEVPELFPAPDQDPEHRRQRPLVALFTRAVGSVASSPSTASTPSSGAAHEGVTITGNARAVGGDLVAGDLIIDAHRLPHPASADQHAEDTGFLATPFESVRGVTRSASVEQVYLNVWFPKFEPRAPRFVVDEPIDMHVDLGPQRHGARPDPLSESLKDRLRRLPRIDVWVQCADADVTPGDGTLELPWPTNVLTFQLVPRRPGGLRIVVVLLIKNQPVHRLEREVQVQDRGARWA